MAATHAQQGAGLEKRLKQLEEERDEAQEIALSQQDIPGPLADVRKEELDAATEKITDGEDHRAEGEECGAQARGGAGQK